jgi:hypothetical protein
MSTSDGDGGLDGSSQVATNQPITNVLELIKDTKVLNITSVVVQGVDPRESGQIGDRKLAVDVLLTLKLLVEDTKEALNLIFVTVDTVLNLLRGIPVDRTGYR